MTESRSESEFVTVRRVRLHVRRWGNPDAPTLFMLHGWMDVAASFQFVVDALGGDWQVILNHYLARMAQPGKPSKQFSPQALELLSRHGWPGNVREIRAIVDTGFHLSDGTVIDPKDFAQSLEEAAGQQQMAPLLASARGAASAPPAEPATVERSIFDRLLGGEGAFWQLVQEPYLERDLNRQQVRDIVARGLRHSGGQYKRLLAAFGIAPADYLKFMDFLRHHRLKPPSGHAA